MHNSKFRSHAVVFAILQRPASPNGCNFHRARSITNNYFQFIALFILLDVILMINYMIVWQSHVKPREKSMRTSPHEIYNNNYFQCSGEQERKRKKCMTGRGGEGESDAKQRIVESSRRIVIYALFTARLAGNFPLILSALIIRM